MADVKKMENTKLNELEKRLQNKRNQESSQKTFFLVNILLLFIGLFFWAQSYMLSDIFTLDTTGFNFANKLSQSQYAHNVRMNENLIKLWGSFFLLFSIGGFSYLYLSGFFKRKEEKELRVNLEEETENYLEIVSLLKSIDKSIEKGKLESVLSSNEKKEIINKISTTIETQLDESLLNKIEEIYGNTIYNEKLSSKSTKLLTETVERLKSEVEKLQRKANINLSAGLFFTISAIIVIANVLMEINVPKDATTLTTIFYYTSRLFLVLLVQGISIFFLRLYKATLNDIMYMNNEVTNYEAKRDALSLAFSTGEVKSSTKMLDQLANTERNFTLKKGETSIFNQRKSTEDDLVDNALLKELLSKLKNK